MAARISKSTVEVHEEDYKQTGGFEERVKHFINQGYEITKRRSSERGDIVELVNNYQSCDNYYLSCASL